MKLDTAIEVFIREGEDLNPDSARRWRLELGLFKEQLGKVYLYELTRDDVFAYRKWYKDHGRSDHHSLECTAQQSACINHRSSSRNCVLAAISQGMDHVEPSPYDCSGFVGSTFYCGAVSKLIVNH